LELESFKWAVESNLEINMEEKKWEKPRLTVISTGDIKENVLTVSGGSSGPEGPPPGSFD